MGIDLLIIKKKSFIFDNQVKKVIYIFLSFIFLISNMGVTIAANYCPMEKGYSFSLSSLEESCCCGDANEGNCCQSKKIEIKKVKDSFVSTAYQSASFHLDLVLIEYAPLSKCMPVALHMAMLFNKDHSPPRSSVPLNILYRSILV